MCGRYAYRASDFDFGDLFGTKPPEECVTDRYNIAPTETVAIIRSRDGEVEAACARWGLIPSWTKDPGMMKLSLFNARAEGVAEKPSFRSAFRSRRCLVPASGFYEWQKREDGKQPYFITRTDGDPIVFAGLWEYWERDGQVIESCTVITTAANADMEGLHHRMPVVLERSEFPIWLEIGPEELLDAAPDGTLRSREVSRRVNNSRSEGAELIESLR